MKEEKKLFKKIKKEGNALVPNLKADIFVSLGINQRKKELSNYIESETIKAEKDKFVPDVKSRLYSHLDIKQKHSISSFLRKPVVIGSLASFLVFAIVSGTLIYTINKSIYDHSNDGSDSASTNPVPIDLALMKVNIISADSGIGKISPVYQSGIASNGKLDPSNIIKNETADYICATYSINEDNVYPTDYLEKMLVGSLKENYISCSNSKGVGHIDITINTLDSDYFAKIELLLKNIIYNFVLNNYVYLTYSINTEEEYSENVANYLANHDLTDEEKQKVSIISNLYEYVFDRVSNDPNPIINTSNFDDWVNKFIFCSLYNLVRVVDKISAICNKGYSPENESNLIGQLVVEFEDTIERQRGFDITQFNQKLLTFKNKLKEFVKKNVHDKIDDESYFDKYYPLKFNHPLFEFEMSDDEISQLSHNDKAMLERSIAYFIAYRNSAPDFDIAYDKMFAEFNMEKYPPNDDYVDHHNHGDGRNHGDDSYWEDDFYDWFDHIYGSH
ncbi:MAG: hypothetical protein WC366_00540 [Bacilli bacterium]|jgi:hypothetical protein